MQREKRFWQRILSHSKLEKSLANGQTQHFSSWRKITVNAFLFYPNIGEKKGLQIKIFEGFTTEWTKFILQNREESGFKHDYDIVIGP